MGRDLRAVIKQVGYGLASKRNGDGTFTASNEVGYGSYKDKDEAWANLLTIFGAVDEDEDADDETSHRVNIPIGLTVAIEPQDENGYVKADATTTLYWLQGGHKKENLVVKSDTSAAADAAAAKKGVEELNTKLNQYKQDSKDYALGLISSIYTYKGAVEAVSELPTEGVTTGDAYYITGDKVTQVAEVTAAGITWTTINTGVTNEQLNTAIDGAKLDLEDEIEAKQDALTDAQQAAVDSGITAALVNKIGESNVSVDTTNMLIKVVSGSKTYAADCFELVTPAIPALMSNSNDLVGVDNVTVTVTCATAGATLYYTTDGTTPTLKSNTVTDGKITLLIDKTATSKSYTVSVISVLRGKVSQQAATKTYVTKRQLKKPTATLGGTAYDAIRTLTLTDNSGASGAALNYKTSSETTYSAYSDAVSVAASGTYNVKAVCSGWQDSEVVDVVVTVNKPAEAYIGAFSKDSITASDLASMTAKTGLSSVAGGNPYSVAIGSTAMYVYFAFLKTLTGATITADPKTTDGFSFPLQKDTSGNIVKTVVGDYYVYRKATVTKDVTVKVNF